MVQGVILLDIDDDLWKASHIKAGDKVQVVGEVDTHRYKPTDIEVVKIEKVMDWLLYSTRKWVLF